MHSLVKTSEFKLENINKMQRLLKFLTDTGEVSVLYSFYPQVPGYMISVNVHDYCEMSWIDFSLKKPDLILTLSLRTAC